MNDPRQPTHDQWFATHPLWTSADAEILSEALSTVIRFVPHPREWRMKLGRKEFETLALEQLDLLYRIARRMTRSETGAEDLVQETFLRALRSFGGFDLKEFGIRPWLLRIMHNLQLSRFKREKRRPATMGDEQLEAAAQTAAGHAGRPLPRDDFDGMDEQLVRALDQLPEEYQTVLLLWAIDELSYKEIAQALEVPIGTVMSRLHRARQRLSVLLHDYAVGRGLVRDAAGKRE